ncbi:hypothetical protein [Seonamhaeicola sp.]|uniref:hypothetical protein n=1 Tax=Seonamhaeicola sp. TaxID=1912245 RepID=UPI0026239BBB|nr:hypothetical protein [Seonamhaeicola sp.]
MKKTNDIQEKVDGTLSAFDAIGEVKVSPFFKDKAMQRLFEEKEEAMAWSWFTPKLQLAILVCFVVLNVLAFVRLDSTEYDTNISEFADSYGLFSDSETSIFN